MNSVTIVDVKEYSSESVSLLIQIELIEFLIIFGITSIFEHSFLTVFYVILALTLFIMAYNNQKIYKHSKTNTIIYIVFGLLLIASALEGYIYG